MGLFSGEKITTVNTVVMRAIEDKLLPNSIKKGAITALSHSQPNQMVGYVSEELINSIGIKCRQMYDYAAKSYSNGLPSGSFVSDMEGVTEAQTILSNIEGTPVTILYSQLSLPNLLHIGWMQLIQYYGYNPTTNILSGIIAPAGLQAYLEDLQVVSPDIPGNINKLPTYYQKGISPLDGYTPTRWLSGLGWNVGFSPIKVDTGSSLPYLKVTYSWEKIAKTDPVTGHPIWNNRGELEYEEYIASFSMPVLINDYDKNADYFHVKYIANNVTKFWLYKMGTGNYPLLDNLYIPPVVPNGTFFPYILFRHEKASVANNPDSNEYKTSKKMVKFLGMDYDEIATSIDENPDIGDVEQAALLFAVPANSENPMEQQYLFEFFDKVYYGTGNQNSWDTISNQIANFFSRWNTYTPKYSLIIKDTKFKIALSHDGVTKNNVFKNIGKVGTYDFELQTHTEKTEYERDGAIHINNVVVYTHIFRKQVSSYMCEELRVESLQTQFHIWGQYTSIGDATEDNNKRLLVPLDYSITKHFSLTDKEILYARSMHYVFNSRVVTKLKWYQSFIFEFVLMVIAVVITALSIGTLGPAMSGIMGAAMAGNVLAMQVLFMILLEKLIILLAIKLFVKAVGPTIALIAAIVAAVYAGYQIISAGSVNNAPFAKELLQLSTNLSESVSKEYQDLIKELTGEYDNFVKLSEEKWEELKSKQDLLDQSVIYSPIVIFGETPDEYYNRTVHSGNIGVMAIDAVSEFVTISLQLPKLSDTLGDSTYAI